MREASWSLSVELEGKSPPPTASTSITWLHSWPGIDMGMVCGLLTAQIASKQTTEPLPDNT